MTLDTVGEYSIKLLISDNDRPELFRYFPLKFNVTKPVDAAFNADFKGVVVNDT